MRKDIEQYMNTWTDMNIIDKCRLVARSCNKTINPHMHYIPPSLAFVKSHLFLFKTPKDPPPQYFPKLS